MYKHVHKVKNKEYSTAIAVWLQTVRNKHHSLLKREEMKTKKHHNVVGGEIIGGIFSFFSIFSQTVFNKQVLVLRD